MEARTQTVAGDGRSWPVAFRKVPLFLSFQPPLLKPLILAFVCFFIHCLNKCTRPFKITGAAPEGTLERCDIPGNLRWLLKNGYVKDRRTRMGKRRDGQNRISVSRQVKQKRLEQKYHTDLPWNHFLCGAFKLKHGFNRWSSWLWGDVMLCSLELMQIKGQTRLFELCYSTPFSLFVKNTWAEGIFTVNLSHNVPKQHPLQPINSTQCCLDLIICSEGHTESLISSGTTKASYTSSSSRFLSFQ